MECVKVRGGQYQLALKRDVLVDFNSEVMNSPCFVEKGFVNDVKSPLLYNPESNIVNEIKKDEVLLKDSSGCAWLVGYMKKDATATVTGILSKDLSKYVSASALSFKDCIQYIDKTNTTVQQPTKTCVAASGSTMGYFRLNDIGYSVGARAEIQVAPTLGDFVYKGQANGTWNTVTAYAVTSDRSTNNPRPERSFKADIAEINSKFNSTSSNYAYVRESFNTMINACSGELFAQHALVKDDNVLQYNGQLISYNNKLWQLEIKQVPQLIKYQASFTFNNTSNGDITALAFFTNIGQACSHLSTNTSNPTGVKFALSYEATSYTVTAKEVEAPETITATIPGASSRRVCNDSLYDIFAIPYSPDPKNPATFKYNNQTYIVDNEVSLLMANLLITELGTSSAGYALDLQLLPFCPLSKGYGSPINCGYGSDKTFSMIQDGNNKIYSYICFPTSANFTVDIPISKNYKKTKTQGVYAEYHNCTAT